MREEQERERMLNRMTLRQRRSYLRKLERGDDVSDIKPKGDDDSDYDFDESDLDDLDEEEEEEEQEEEEE